MTTPVVAPRLFVTPFLVNAGGIGTLQVTLDDLWLRRVRIVVPDGHAGLTALQIQKSGVPYFPIGPDPFLRGNDEVIDFEWQDQVQANSITLLGFNSDIYPHTWFLRWEITDLPAASPVTISSPQAAPLPAGTAGAVAGLAGAADSGSGLSPDDLAAIAAAGLNTGGP